ncbi:MAG: hypothetical protein HY308_08190 [Gammaproteobacteria bacterium]|nr:hypothetical protein [Gammaproteobacteria bacterium]
MADVVATIIVKTIDGEKYLSVKQFLEMSPEDRTNLILEDKISFLDANGSAIRKMDALRSLKDKR